MWDDGKGHFLRELVSGYIGYTWFSFASVKAVPHPAPSANTVNMNTRFLFGVFVSYAHTHALIGCKEL